MNADPMNDPSTEMTAPACSVCGQPAAGAYVHDGHGTAFCQHPDCESRVRQQAHQNAERMDLAEPWPAAQPGSPTVADLGGGASAASAGAEPPADLAGAVPLPAHAVATQGDSIDLDTLQGRNEHQEAQEALRRGLGRGSEEVRILRERAYMVLLEAQERYRAFADKGATVAERMQALSGLLQQHEEAGRLLLQLSVTA